jgi:hypothetical protein
MYEQNAPRTHGPAGLMVKASDFESEDCRFESCVGLSRIIVFVEGMLQFCYTARTNRLKLFFHRKQYQYR